MSAISLLWQPLFLRNASHANANRQCLVGIISAGGALRESGPVQKVVAVAYDPIEVT